MAILRASGNDLLVPLGVLIESALNNLFVFVTRELNDVRTPRTCTRRSRSVRLQRPDAARNAVRKLLANTDQVIGRNRR